VDLSQDLSIDGSWSGSRTVRNYRFTRVVPNQLQFLAEISSLTGRRGEDLGTWMAAADDDDLPALHSFVHGLRRDLPAVVAGLTLPSSNGPIEGANTKVRFLKRQMYGRAGFDLLRQRILLA
jgi:transposase